MIDVWEYLFIYSYSFSGGKAKEAYGLTAKEDYGS